MSKAQLEVKRNPYIREAGRLSHYIMMAAGQGGIVNRCTKILFRLDQLNQFKDQVELVKVESIYMEDTFVFTNSLPEDSPDYIEVGVLVSTMMDKVHARDYMQVTKDQLLAMIPVWNAILRKEIDVLTGFVDIYNNNKDKFYNINPDE